MEGKDHNAQERGSTTFKQGENRARWPKTFGKRGEIGAEKERRSDLPKDKKGKKK